MQVTADKRFVQIAFVASQTMHEERTSRIIRVLWRKESLVGLVYNWVATSTSTTSPATHL